MHREDNSSGKFAILAGILPKRVYCLHCHFILSCFRTMVYDIFVVTCVIHGMTGLVHRNSNTDSSFFGRVNKRNR